MDFQKKPSKRIQQAAEKPAMPERVLAVALDDMPAEA